MSGADDKLYERFGRDFPTGHVLFKEGEPGNEMFVIQAGKVRISKTVRDVEKTLVVLGAGEFFGEMSILNNKPRSATATVDDNAKLLVIDPKTFEAMVRGNAEIAVRMIKKLAARLQETDEQIENLLLKDHNSRVVHYLSHLSGRQGRQVADGVALDVTVKELAAKIGLDLDRVDDVLNKLIRARLVKITETGLVIHDVNKLRDFLEFLEMKEKFGDI
jgi:CRP/FNR family transcriptional regulator, cyclic AMP receptor protein